MTARLARILVMLTLAAGWLAPWPVRAEAEEDSLTRLKAAFVLNFIRYTEWPASAFGAADAPLRVAVVDDPAAASYLVALTRHELVQGHAVEVRRVTVGDGGVEQVVKRLAGFHVVYFCGLARGTAAAILRELPPEHTLTVGDMEGFVRRGGMLGVARQRGRLGIEANLEAIRRSRLTVSSKLLRLARIERTEDSP